MFSPPRCRVLLYTVPWLAPSLELLKVVGPPSEMLALLTTTAPAFVVSPRPTAPTLSTVAEVRTAAPQMFLG